MSLVYCADPAVQTGTAHKPRQGQDRVCGHSPAPLQRQRPRGFFFWFDSMGANAYLLGCCDWRWS